jgi:hypothetical protein
MSAPSVISSTSVAAATACVCSRRASLDDRLWSSRFEAERLTAQGQLQPGLLPRGLLPDRGVEDGIGEGADLAGPLGKVDEVVRCQQPAGWVLPARERLDANDSSRGKVNFGLVQQHQLTSGDGTGQRSGQLQAVSTVEVAVRRVHGPTEMVALGFVHCDIGMLEQRVGVGSVVRPERDADAGLDLKTHPVDRYLRHERSFNLRSNGNRAEIVHVRNEQRELITAEPGHGDVPCNRAREARTELAEHDVTHAMAETVADLLEAVEVDHQHGKPVIACGALQRGLQCLVETAAIREARELVGAGLQADISKVAQLAVADGQTGDGDDQRCDRQRECDREQVVKAVERHDGQRSRHEEDGHEDRPTGRPGAQRSETTMPSAERNPVRGDRPEPVERSASHVGPRSDAPHVDTVGHREQGQAEGKEPPQAAGATAPDGEEADEHRDEQEIADRIGDVREHGRGVSLRCPQDRSENEGRADRGDAQPGDEPVRPRRAGALGKMRSDQQAQPDVGERIEGQAEACD